MPTSATPPPDDLVRLDGAFRLLVVWVNVILPKQAGTLANLRDKLRK